MGGEDDHTPPVTLPPKPPTSFSSSIRLLGLVKQPESEPDIRLAPTLELDERDVIWPSDLKPDPFEPDDSESEPEPESDIRSPSTPDRRIYPASGFGLSAVFADDGGMAVRRPARPLTGLIGAGPDALAKSAPVNVPTWHVRRKPPPPMFVDVEEENMEEDGEMVPPHVIVARSHVTLSVFEGVGRTLKGRDLRRVRNAVFQQTGFLD